MTADEGYKFLSIYLEDHVAGATAGSQRASRLAEGEADSADGAVLAEFDDDVAADLRALLSIMETLGVQPSRLKAGVASVGERLGALKPNGRIVQRSPLTTIVELEAMQMAVRGKRSLWETLRALLPQPGSADLAALIARADDQLRVLSTVHGARVRATFALPVATERGR
ncbi:MAG: hypothetical protein JWM34_1619 [Ilumatobacteraceae bacterium]|nr:hypothetical protein [Ilumatobacteraceae bacterium]